MWVTMMRIGYVRVSVRERVVPVRMRMRLRQRTVVRVLMMRVVHVQVVVLERLVRVQVLVSQAQKRSDSERHEGRRSHVQGRGPVTEERDRRRGAGERSRRE